MYKHFWLPIWIIMAVALVNCDSSSTNKLDEGHHIELFTWNPDDADTYPQSTIGIGTIVIADNCVLLTLENGKVVLPIWPEPTTWEASSKVIKFVDVQGNKIDLHEGDEIMPSGYTRGNDDDTPSSLSDHPCDAEEEFVLNSLVKK